MKTSIACVPKTVNSMLFWERSVDPFHPNAFVEALPLSFPKIWDEEKCKQSEGWMAIDWCGNPIGFIADGSEVPAHGQEFLLRESYPGRLCAVLNDSIIVQQFNEVKHG